MAPAAILVRIDYLGNYIMVKFLKVFMYYINVIIVCVSSQIIYF